MQYSAFLKHFWACNETTHIHSGLSWTGVRAVLDYIVRITQNIHQYSKTERVFSEESRLSTIALKPLILLTF